MEKVAVVKEYSEAYEQDLYRVFYGEKKLDAFFEKVDAENYANELKNKLLTT
jgi:hypothetical protein